MREKWATNWTFMPTWRRTRLAPMSPSIGFRGSEPCGRIANSSRWSSSSTKPRNTPMSKSSPPIIQVPNQRVRSQTQAASVLSHISKLRKKQATKTRQSFAAPSVNPPSHTRDRQYWSVRRLAGTAKLPAGRLRSFRGKGNAWILLDRKGILSTKTGGKATFLPC